MNNLILVDVDDTVLTSSGPPIYSMARPVEGAVDAINKLWGMGYVVDFFTGRNHNLYDATLRDLEKFGFKFRRLIMGKPHAALYIGNEAVRHMTWSRTMLDVGHRTNV